MPYQVGEYVKVKGVVRRLESRINTMGDWKLNRDIGGSAYANEAEMVRSERSPVEPQRTRKYWNR